MADKIRIGLLGFGTVGAAFADLLEARRQTLIDVCGIEFVITGVAVRDLAKYDMSAYSFEATDNPDALVNSDDVDLVVELIGGVEPAKSLINTALKSKKAVVSANKELIASHGAQLFQSAAENSVDLLFEASTAGAIPILRPLRESLLGEDVSRVMGIVNGTTNYILDEMTTKGLGFDKALADAQELGYAEADPTADVGGHDASAKAAIMASIAFGQDVQAQDVHTEGITEVTSANIAEAGRLGHVIKLLAIATKSSDGALSVSTYPCLLSDAHPLASVHGSYNAVFVEGESCGELMFYGRGAGGAPTASAVLGDVVDAGQNLVAGTHHKVPTGPRAKLKPLGDTMAEYYIVVQTQDSPGVLSEVSGLFAKNMVSIKAIEQEPMTITESNQEVNVARIVFLTQSAKESDYAKLLTDLDASDSVRQIQSRIRVVG